MQKLGYSPGKLLAVAQQISEEWDMNDVDDGPVSKVASVLAYAGGIEKPERTPEDRELEDAEYQALAPYQ
ncbi:Bacteriophage regulatory protein [Phytophthora palmivora]|uniref:Bacteriophage regulatory protein n=1 Tax=Phytophthora palmivora TaxID=4796 RepID=A0A2P4YMN0_9STRA|nr:Bacteriophage regulatory protein [Phytophthora palmivora]